MWEVIDRANERKREYRTDNANKRASEGGSSNGVKENMFQNKED